MSDSKHTKREWTHKLSKKGSHYLISGDYQWENFAKVVSHCSGVMKEEALANANLITQSPKMYKWCMERLNFIQKIKDAGLLDPKYTTEYNELMAIKKATS